MNRAPNQAQFPSFMAGCPKKRQALWVFFEEFYLQIVWRWKFHCIFTIIARAVGTQINLSLAPMVNHCWILTKSWVAGLPPHHHPPNELYPREEKKNLPYPPQINLPRASEEALFFRVHLRVATKSRWASNTRIFVEKVYWGLFVCLFDDTNASPERNIL